MVLASALLMLVVVTVLAIGLFRSFGMDEKIAGNTREKQRATQAAISAEQYAEWWLLNGVSATPITCSTKVTASVTVGQICNNALSASVTNVAVVPWMIGGVNVQVTYNPPNMTINNTTTSAGTFYAAPAFYISYLGVGTGANGISGNVYQIDAVGYGGTQSTAAVVESTFIVQTTTVNNVGGNGGQT
jgi:type IV pilus assembly protein PilX